MQIDPKIYAAATPEQRLKFDAVIRFGGFAAAERALNLGNDSIRAIYRRLKRKAKRGNPPQSDTTIPPEPPRELTRAEAHDAAFWKRRYTAELKARAEIEHLCEKLGGIRDLPYRIPDWLLPTSQGRRGKSVIGGILSDVHMGEVIAAEEIQGINAFNSEICRQRLRRYFTGACTIGQRWASDTDCQGFLLPLIGDLISGDIHEELRITNDLTSHEQVQAMVEECAAGIRILLETYGRVHVIGAPGNHGRNTPKSTAKLYSRLSYDMMIVAMLQREFADNDRVTFQASAAKDQIVPIFGRSLLATHGDKMGTGGGQGFAGPMLPIVRGTKKIEAQQASVGRKPDLIIHGHYHTTGNPGNVLSNGSVPGYSEYSDDLRCVVEPPQQWLYLLHDRWWLRERAPIQLEEPTLPEKPRVRVPISWAGAA